MNSVWRFCEDCVKALEAPPAADSPARFSGWRSAIAAVWNGAAGMRHATVPPATDRERIFRPYERGPDERRARGGGLGLAICREIVERHGGEIGVAPTEDGDNRFAFTLPA